MAKVCSKCKVEQPVSEFSENRNTADGLQYVCKNCTKSYYKQYIFANKEQIREKKKQYCAGHKEESREYNKQYRAEHKEYLRKTDSARKKNHPEAKRVYEQSRRARKAGLARTLTPMQWKSILDAFLGQCAYCGSVDKTLHQEHFISLYSGGEYTHDNIIPACKSCNSSKNARDFFTWYPKCEFYNKARERKIMRFLHYTGSAQQLTLCP